MPMRPASARAKGRRLQLMVAVDLQRAFDLSPDDCRSCPSGAHGEDVQLSAAARRVVPWSIECKNQERIVSAALWSAFEQAVRNAGDHTPVVVAKKNHHPAVCMMRWTDALALLQRASGAPQPEPSPPEPSPPSPQEPSPPEPSPTFSPLLPSVATPPEALASHIREAAPPSPRAALRDAAQRLRRLADEMDAACLTNPTEPGTAAPSIAPTLP